MVTRQQLVEEARTWLDVPWRHLGRNRAGIDCVGLGVEVLKSLDLPWHDVPSYSSTPHAGLIAHIKQVCDPIKINDIKPGDVLVFRTAHYPFHVGMVSEKYGKLHVIHATAARRKVVEEPFAHELVDNVTHAFRIRGIE